MSGSQIEEGSKIAEVRDEMVEHLENIAVTAQCYKQEIERLNEELRQSRQQFYSADEAKDDADRLRRNAERDAGSYRSSAVFFGCLFGLTVILASIHYVVYHR